ncbi:MAG TPA: peptidoglycan DD-metalloendopeptidase family protein [Gammaproteobacteria bacterium]|nr:peptidoglycan DD-metalloendopeptidase family protein [Gammaproteobacteria bacterium]
MTGAIAASEKSATAARDELSSLLRDAFVLGREPALKLALEGDDPATAARLLAYYGYYSRAQTAQIAALTAELAQYRSLQSRLADTGRELENTVATRKSSLADLEQSRDRRKALVARLASDISRTHAQADSLRADAARLEKIVRSVRRDIAAAPPPPVPAGVAFGKLRGRLPWPVAGKIVDRYGSARADGELEWRAVRIAAPGGTRVHAIAYGRVVYAGWLPYYGLVLMIDHGDGFLAVYGHNEALYKQVGDRVRPGDVITTVGVSGGQPRPMLYFQLRHDDQPLDPSQWCVAGGPPRRP